jgi:hypothetical protein
LTTLRDALDQLPSTPPPIAPKIELPVIDRQASTIEWKGIHYPVRSGTADAFVAMIEAKGQPVGLGKYVRKPGEWLKDLEKTSRELANIVERAPGNQGYRVTIFDQHS